MFILFASRFRSGCLSIVCAYFINFQIALRKIGIYMAMGLMMSTSKELSHSMKKLRLSKAVRDDDLIQSPVRLALIFDTSSPSSPYRKQAGGHGRILDDATRAPLDNWSTIGSIDVECVIASMTDVGLADHVSNPHEETPVLHCDRFATTDQCASHAAMVPEHDCGDGISNSDLLSFLRACVCQREASRVEADVCYGELVNSQCSSSGSAACRLTCCQYIEPTNAELLSYVKKK